MCSTTTYDRVGSSSGRHVNETATACPATPTSTSRMRVQGSRPYTSCPPGAGADHPIESSGSGVGAGGMEVASDRY
ncbi:hypothetical protein GS439_17870 [Rhodococcus hoagii]|nr:hypothetical protein [Prescottella equi]